MRAPLNERLRELTDASRWEEAFALLYKERHATVKRFIRTIWDAAPVDDVSQVVWLGVRNSLQRFRFESELDTWLFAIAEKKIADARRKRQEAVVSDPDAPEMRWSNRLSDSGSPFSKLLYTERARLIRQIIAGWKKADRQMFEMRFFAGLGPMVIAATFDPPEIPNTVTQRLKTLVLVLRERLAEITSVASR
jgi:RNA polymerase sigma factor (sigma-70 family)